MPDYDDNDDRREDYDRFDRRDDGDDRGDRRLQRAKSAIMPAAICLIIIGIVGALAAMYNFVSFATFDAQWDVQIKAQTTGKTAQQKKDIEDMMKSLKEPVKFGTLAGGIIGLVTGLMAIFGGIMNMKLKSRGLGMIATILNMIPICGGCCCLGIPLGIWILIVLGKTEVKQGFDIVSRQS